MEFLLPSAEQLCRSGPINLGVVWDFVLGRLWRTNVLIAAVADVALDFSLVPKLVIQASEDLS